jgi:hypothetical protein
VPTKFAAVPQAGWWRFAGWVPAGALAFFGWTSAFPAGIALVAVSIVLVWLAGKNGRVWPESLGLAAGAGVFGLVTALQEAEAYRQCAAGVPAEVAAIQCAAIDPTPWLVGGLVLGGLAPLAYVAACRKIEKAH